MGSGRSSTRRAHRGGASRGNEVGSGVCVAVVRLGSARAALPKTSRRCGASRESLLPSLAPSSATVDHTYSEITLYLNLTLHLKLPGPNAYTCFDYC